MDIHQRIKRLKNLPAILAAVEKEGCDFTLEGDHAQGLSLQIRKPDTTVLVMLDEERLAILLGIPELIEGFGITGDTLSNILSQLI